MKFKNIDERNAQYRNSPLKKFITIASVSLALIYGVSFYIAYELQQKYKWLPIPERTEREKEEAYSGLDLSPKERKAKLLKDQSDRRMRIFAHSAAALTDNAKLEHPKDEVDIYLEPILIDQKPISFTEKISKALFTTNRK